MIDWIAAGFAPAAFGDQTLREVQRALRGAEKRRRQALADAALTAWIGAHTDRDGLRDFLAGLDETRRAPLPPAAQARALESMAQKMAVISMDEYRARRGGAA